jgi:hypothetical protein
VTWIDCLLSPVFSSLLVIVGTLLVALAWLPIGELATHIRG